MCTYVTTICIYKYCVSMYHGAMWNPCKYVTTIFIIQKVAEVQKWLGHELSGIDREITQSVEQ